MPPAQFIVHNGKQILLMDFSSATSTAEITRMAEEIKKFVALHQPQSLLGLVDFTGIRIDRATTGIIKDMAGHNRKYIRFIALVGLGSIRSVMLRMMLFLSGKSNHKVFGTRDKALEWLGYK